MGYSYNHVTLVGRLTRDPEGVQLSGGLSKAVFTLAVQRGFKKDGMPREVDFIPVSIWGKMGQVALQVLKKGVPVLVWGRIHIKNFQVDNKRVWAADIVAENFQILQARAVEPESVVDQDA